MRFSILHLQAKHMIFSSFPQVILNLYISVYFFCVSYKSRVDGTRATPAWQQIAALTTGLASVMFTLSNARWKLQRYGSPKLARVLRQNLCLNAIFVATTILWTMFEVLARIAAIIIFSIGYQAWIGVAILGEYLIRVGLLYLFVNARLGGASEKYDSVWLRALRQLLVHEVHVDTNNSSVDRIVFFILSLVIQVGFLTQRWVFPLIPESVALNRAPSRNTAGCARVAPAY